MLRKTGVPPAAFSWRCIGPQTPLGDAVPHIPCKGIRPKHFAAVRLQNGRSARRLLLAVHGPQTPIGAKRCFARGQGYILQIVKFENPIEKVSAKTEFCENGSRDNVPCRGSGTESLRTFQNIEEEENL